MGEPIRFFLPREYWPAGSPHSPDWTWLSACGGNARWTLQTWMWMRSRGLDCELVSRVPDSGIVVAHTRHLPKRILPRRGRFLVCIEADRGRRPFCQLHVQQNPEGTVIANRRLAARLDRRIARLPASNHFMYYWPQPGLVPRDAGRGERFENVVYMGNVANIAPELLEPGFRERLKALGMNFVFEKDPLRWRDYSNVDAVLAVRDFTGRPHHRKPASKLINAWHAGVPALLAPESAYLAERRSELDFMVVRSVDDIVEALARLKADPELRRRMIGNGRQRAE